jgi:glycosyltransferase involved in cell wall biosynthesis
MTLPVTCIIPCHNNASTLNKAVESAIDQCDSVIVVFDGDNGDGYETLESHFRNPTHLDYFSTHSAFPAGVCHARNLAIGEADDGLILPLDADDWLAEGAVEAMKTAYKPGHFVYGNWVEVNGNGMVDQRPPKPSMIHHKNIGYASFMFDKKDWHKAGGYSPEFNIGGEHWGFMASLIYKAKVKPLYIDYPVFFYNRTASKRYSRANRYHTTIKNMVMEVINGVT